ncbi:MAG: hypothetical protein KC561_17260, partial [Myxococcales bacterium]|nr:hypothetical protein [Myxococcales bacterium]
MRSFPILTLIAVLVSPVVASAQDDPARPGVGELTEAPDEPQFGLDLGAGFSRVEEDSFIDTNLGFSFGLGDLEMGLWVPLRFRVIDEAPETDDVIRHEDWDEVADYFRILRYVQYGSRGDTYWVRGGELANVTMGHGTIVSGYNNVIDVNHFQWGLTGGANFSFGGLELLLDNITNPDLMGFRVFARPWQFIDPESYWTNLAVGMSLIGDVGAPIRLEQNSVGEYVIDDERNLVVGREKATGVLGFDVELQAFSNDLVALIPYADMNIHLGLGSGFHLGNLANFSFSEAVALNLRLEFRALGEGYSPSYFDGLYEYERLLFRPLDATGQRRPKLQVLELFPEEARVGWYSEGTLALFRLVYLTMAFEDYQGDDNSSFWARLALPQVGPLSLGAYYINQNFDGASEM